MIPLRDESRYPSRRPLATFSLIVANGIVFVLELAGGDAFVMQWAATPADIAGGHHWITIVSSMFMHGSWLHIVGNMVFLWAFGPQIEAAMTPRRYLAFYFVGGVVAACAQILADPHSTVPILGASGAIAAVMGAFLVTYPRDKIRTLVLFGWFYRVTFIPAALLIGVWFLIQLLNVGSVAEVQSGGVAYLAHVGGIVYGAVTARLFEGRAFAQEGS